MLIFGEAFSSPVASISINTSSSEHTRSLAIRIARITPAARAPRPDDPTPRKPPVHLTTSKKIIGELAANTRIRPRGNAKEESEVVRRAREVMLHLPNSKPRGRGKEKDKEKGPAVFKVPALPARKTDHAAVADVFGPVGDAKGKARAVNIEAMEEGIGDVEQENKSVCLPLLVLFVVAPNRTYLITDNQEIHCQTPRCSRYIQAASGVQGTFRFRLPWYSVCSRAWSIPPSSRLQICFLILAFISSEGHD
jgi:hypothetical protein